MLHFRMKNISSIPYDKLSDLPVRFSVISIKVTIRYSNLESSTNLTWRNVVDASINKSQLVTIRDVALYDTELAKPIGSLVSISLL